MGRLQEEIAAFEAERRPAKKKTTDQRTIGRAVFWEIIESCRETSASSIEFVDNVRTKLECFACAQIRRFEQELLEGIQELKSWDLLALAYIVRRGCSDDEFEYFCAWLIAQGQSAFELGCTDVARLAESLSIDEDPQLEQLLYAAQDAYDARSDSPMKPVTVKTRELRGGAWQETELATKYQGLCLRFNYASSR